MHFFIYILGNLWYNYLVWKPPLITTMKIPQMMPLADARMPLAADAATKFMHHYMNTNPTAVANQVQAFYYDGNTPIGQLSDGREIVLTQTQVKAVLRKIFA